MEVEETDYEWELSKENVQPLRQGRQMSSLAVALHSAPNEEVIKENQRAFEEELRAYTGDDPFDVWDRYIKWTEQYFPKGGHEGHLSKLIQHCLQQFQADPSYMNDSRFIRLWIKYATMSDKPTEVYSYMFDNAIGHKVASFYVEWALALELDNNIQNADTVYTEGLNRLAEPRDLLLQKQQQFEYRLARNIKLQRDDGESEMEVGDTTEEEERSALSRLKASGARHKVGTTRTGAVKLGSAGLFKTSKETSAKQVPSKGISIFEDKENVSSRPQETHEWKSMPRKVIDNRENDKKPGTWTEARIRQKLKDVPPAPSYQIHEDAEQPALETPQKTTFINKQPLSSRKADPKSDVLSEIRNPHVVHPGEGLPQYQKHNVYNGVSEFSFEELRAIRYWKRKKERELEAEKLRLEEQKRQQQEAQLKEQSEMIARMKSLLQSKGLDLESLQNEVQQIPQDQQRQQLQQLPQMTAEDQPPRLTMQANLSSMSSQAQSSQKSSHMNKNSSDGTSARQEIFSQRMEAAAANISSASDFITPTNQSGYSGQPGSTTSNTSSCGSSHRTPIFNDMSAYGNKSSRASSSSNSSLIKLCKNRNIASSGSTLNESSNPAHNTSSLSSESRKHSFAHSTPGSNETSMSQKTPYGLPSPTVCTKEALQLVQGMFCTDLEQDNLGESLHEHEKSKPFKIREDVPSEEPKPSSFQIHCDEQSEMPTSVKKENARSFGSRKSFLPMDDGNDFTIEGQARDDITIAPLGNFSMQARAASTPFSSSDIKRFETTQELRSEVSLNSCSTSATGYIDGATNAKGLSPINEGSEGSGSTEETHSTKFHSQMSELGISTKARTTLNHGCSIKEENEEAEGDVSMYDDEPLDATHHHLIDTSACGAMYDERTQDLLSASACKVPQNPFDERRNAEYLSRLTPPMSSYPNYYRQQGEFPDYSVYSLIQMDTSKDEYISVEKCLGEGGYAKVLLISKNSMEEGDTEYLAMKVQKPPCYWEFYAACEMRKRLTTLNAPMDVTPAITDMQAGYFYDEGSLLFMNFVEHGSLLNLVNLYKADRNLMAGVEPFACLLTIELLHLIEQIHKCDFIHGDVKPDNFLFRRLPELANSQNRQEVFGSQLQMICLTDFGQSIDLKMFPSGTTFKAKVVTRAFQCTEMRTDRPWTFQTDLFGLAGTVHVALFGSYMKVFMEKGTWKITGSFVRKWNVPLWKKLFHELLNIPSCDLMPNLTALRREFEDYVMSGLIQPYNGWVKAISGRLIKEAALENTL